MRTPRLLAAALLAVPLLVATAPAAQAATVTTFSDAFTGTAGKLPDPTKWGYDVGRWGDGLTYFTKTNATLDGAGHLAIRVRRETPPDGDTTRPFTGSRMTTRGLSEFGPGTRVRIVAKLPAAGSGQWPALWFLGNNPADPGNWPEEGEIDMMETRTSHPAYTDAAHRGTFEFLTLHGPGNTAATAHTDEPLGFSGRWNSAPTPIPDLSADYHVFGMVWRADGITFSIADVGATAQTVWTVSRAQYEAAGGRWVFDGSWPFALLLNNYADSGFKPAGDPSGDPLLVDSVSVVPAS